jgi:hypothetical protein
MTSNCPLPLTSGSDTGGIKADDLSPLKSPSHDISPAVLDIADVLMNVSPNSTSMQQMMPTSGSLASQISTSAPEVRTGFASGASKSTTTKPFQDNVPAEPLLPFWKWPLSTQETFQARLSPVWQQPAPPPSPPHSLQVTFPPSSKRSKPSRANSTSTFFSEATSLDDTPTINLESHTKLPSPDSDSTDFRPKVGFDSTAPDVSVAASHMKIIHTGMEDRFETIIASVEDAGFDSIDSMSSAYYTTSFGEHTAIHALQSQSRSRRLRTLLASLRQKSAEWIDREAQGYREEIMRGAEDIFTRELSKTGNRASQDQPTVKFSPPTNHDKYGYSGVGDSIGEKVLQVLADRGLGTLLKTDMARLQTTVSVLKMISPSPLILLAWRLTTGCDYEGSRAMVPPDGAGKDKGAPPLGSFIGSMLVSMHAG